MTVGILQSIHGSHKSKSDTQSAIFIHKKNHTQGGKYWNCREKKSSKVSPKASCNDSQWVFQAQNKSCYLGDDLRTLLSCHPKNSTAAWPRSCTAPGEAVECDMPVRSQQHKKKKKEIPAPGICPGVSSNPTRLTPVYQCFWTENKLCAEIMDIMLELQSQCSILLAAPDWWAKVENKASKGPWPGPRGIKGNSWVPNHQEEVTGCCPRVRHPQEHWRGTMWGAESGIAVDTAKIGLDLKVSRSLDQLVQNNHTWLGGASFCFVFCLFGGSSFTWANLSPRLQPCSNSPKVGTTTSRIFSMRGKSLILFPFSNYTSHFCSPLLILYPIRLSPLPTTLHKAQKAFSPIFPY